MRKNKETIMSMVLSIIIVLFMWKNINMGYNNVIFLFLFLAVYLFFKNNFKKYFLEEEKRKKYIILVISTIFSIVEMVGNSINIDFTLDHIFDVYFIINLCGYIIISYTIIEIIYNILENYKLENKRIDTIKCKFIKNDFALFIACAVLIFIAWIPYYISYYPGIISPDSYSQIQQMMGDMNLSNHHPILHTSIIGVFVNLGVAIFNNINIGIAIYTIFQMIVLSFIYSYTIKFLRKNNVPFYIRIIVLLYYMFYPINATYSVIMWKDILFSGVFPIFIIYCYKIIFKPDEFFIEKKNTIKFIIISLLMIYLRHNGYYVTIFTLLVFFIAIKQYWKNCIKILTSVIVFNIIINSFIYSIIKVDKGSAAEAMSIPLQQIARVVKNHPEIDEDIRERFNKFLYGETTWELYEPTCSDAIKFKFRNELYEENKLEFWKLWLKVLIKYPKDCIEATIANSYGYYYIGATNNVLSTYNISNEYNIILKPTEDNFMYRKFISLIGTKRIPIISALFNIGTVFWLTIILLGFQIYKKRYKYIVIYLPILILWLTCVASPVYNELRYAYPLFTTLPIFICFNFMQDKEKMEQNK